MGELKLLPLVSLLAGHSEPRTLPAPVIAVLEPVGEPHAALLLADQAVAVRYTLHPLLVAWLTTVGWLPEKRSALGDVALLKYRPSPKTVTDPSLGPLHAALTPSNAAAMLSGLLRGNRRFTVELPTGSAVISAGRIEATAERTLLRFAEVERFVEQHRSLGGIVCGSPAWFKLDQLAHTTLRLTPAPANPALVSSTLGSVLSVTESSGAALSRVEDLHLQLPVAIHPAVIDVAAMATAAGTDRPGLLAEQDRLVSILLASEVGAVLAPPPGSGKTVITAAALAELAPRSALIAAPPAVLEQWAAELAAWAPQVNVAVARTAEQLSRLRPRHQVLIASHQVAARATSTWRSKLEVLVIDEAHALLRRSETGTMLRAARRLAQRAWALTGSPDESAAVGDVADLVAWVRNLPAAAVASAPAAVFEPILCGADGTARARLRLPELIVESIPVSASPEELVMVNELCAIQLPERGLSRHRALERRRLLLGDLGAESSFKLNHIPAKREQLLARTTAHAAAGGSVLVFSSTLTVLQAFLAELRHLGVSAELLPGSDARTDRVRTLSAFNEGTLAVLAVPPSSQRGLNLQRADLVVHLDLPGTSAEFAQRNGRAARIGSPVARRTAPHAAASPR